MQLGAILRHSNASSLRIAGFKDEDDDEYENEAPGEAPVLFLRSPPNRSGLPGTPEPLVYPKHATGYQR
jgi:hypothetical protein